MNTKPTLLAASIGTLLLGVSAQSLAGGMSSWDYMSVEYVVAGDAEETGYKEDIEGYRVDAAKSLGSIAMIRALSNVYNADIGPDFSADISTQQVGVGAHFPINAGPVIFDLWGTANYERVSYFGAIGTGPGADVGVRAHIMSGFELGATTKVLGDVDFGGGIDADYTGYTIHAAFQLMPTLSLLASYSNHDLEIDEPGMPSYKFKYNNAAGIGVRFNY